MTPFELLQRLVDSSESGILFVRTEEGHQARFGLVGGKLIHISYAMRRGTEALERLANSHAASASFTRGLAAPVHDDLPAPEPLLRMLQAILGEGAATATSIMSSASPPRTEPPLALPPRPPVATTSANPRERAAIDRLRALMIDSVGPIGGLLVDQETRAGVGRWVDLVDRLAREVSPQSEAQAFRTAALKLLS